MLSLWTKCPTYWSPSRVINQTHGNPGSWWKCNLIVHLWYIYTFAVYLLEHVESEIFLYISEIFLYILGQYELGSVASIWKHCSRLAVKAGVWLDQVCFSSVTVAGRHTYFGQWLNGQSNRWCSDISSQEVIVF